MLAFTRLNFLTGPYIINSAPTNVVKSPAVMSPVPMRLMPYHNTATIASAPNHSINGGSTDKVLVTFIVIRYNLSEARINRSCSNRSAENAFTIR